MSEFRGSLHRGAFLLPLKLFPIMSESAILETRGKLLRDKI